MELDLQMAVDHSIQIRVNFKKLLESLPEEQLYVIPKGFKNNIMWHFAHTVVTQQILIYKLAGLPMIVSEDLINKYRKGTDGDPTFLPGFKDEIILTSYSTLEKFQTDILTPEIFQNFQTYPTSFGIELNSYEQAIRFNNIHESLHLGYAMAMRKLLQAG